jgi:hypothetical protein
MDFLKVQGRGVDKENLDKKKENGNCRRQDKARKKRNDLLWIEPNGRASRRPCVPQGTKGANDDEAK